MSNIEEITDTARRNVSDTRELIIEIERDRIWAKGFGLGVITTLALMIAVAASVAYLVRPDKKITVTQVASGMHVTNAFIQPLGYACRPRAEGEKPATTELHVNGRLYLFEEK